MSLVRAAEVGLTRERAQRCDARDAIMEEAGAGHDSIVARGPGLVNREIAVQRV
jgi:hypothetical protein